MTAPAAAGVQTLTPESSKLKKGNKHKEEIILFDILKHILLWELFFL
jgi:hypothetical protein